MAAKTYALTRNRVKELRRARGLTQQQAACAVGLRCEFIQSIEAGRFDASLPNPFEISRFFGLHIEEIFSCEGDRVPAPSPFASPRA